MLKGLECTISAKVNKVCSGNKDWRRRGGVQYIEGETREEGGVWGEGEMMTKVGLGEGDVRGEEQAGGKGD